MTHSGSSLKLPKSVRAIIWMLLHCVALVLIMGVVRQLGHMGVSTYTIIFWQNVFSFTILASSSEKALYPLSVAISQPSQVS